MCGVFIKEIKHNFPKAIGSVWTTGKGAGRMEIPPPPKTPPYVQKAITELAKKEVDELRCYADTKRRSDSFPTGRCDV